MALKEYWTLKGGVGGKGEGAVVSTGLHRSRLYSDVPHTIFVSAFNGRSFSLFLWTFLCSMEGRSIRINYFFQYSLWSRYSKILDTSEIARILLPFFQTLKLLRFQNRSPHGAGPGREPSSASIRNENADKKRVH